MAWKFKRLAEHESGFAQQTDRVQAKGSTEQYEYLGYGTTESDTDIDACRTAFKTWAADVTPAGLIISMHSLSPVIGAGGGRGAIYLCRAEYVHPLDVEGHDRDEESKTTRIASFSTMGGTGEIYQALAQTEHARAGETAPAVNGAVRDDGEKVEGVDIVTPSLRLTLRGRLPIATVTNTWVKERSRQTGTVNDAPYESYAAGELLFHGVEGDETEDGQWVDCVWQFEASENRTDITRDGITFDKEGHQYVWYRYRQEKDDVAKTRVSRAEAAYVATVYESSAFDTLGVPA